MSCCSLADEVILSIVEGLKWVFDGKKEYFGRRPDLTDWDQTVKIKLRRMHYDTSQIVSNVMHDYNIGPWTRIGIELIPSMVLHAKNRKNQFGRTLAAKYTEEEVTDAIDTIQNISSTKD